MPSLMLLKRGYDQYGNLTESYDGNGNRTHYVYDSNSVNLAAKCDGFGTGPQRDTTYQLDSPSGLIDTQTDYNGLTRVYSYDAVNRLSEVIDQGVGGQLPQTQFAYLRLCQLNGTAIPRWVRRGRAGSRALTTDCTTAAFAQ